MARHGLEEKLSNVSGVVSSSKFPVGAQPWKVQSHAPKNGNENTKQKKKSKLCTICGSGFSECDSLKQHFVACVERNGNPKGLHWDEDIKFVPRGPRKGGLSTESTDASSTPRKKTKTPEERKARLAKDAEKLAAVNGVMVPSKLAPGEAPNQGYWVNEKDNRYPCSLCSRGFKTKIHVKSHFPTCVQKNGNPSGIHWDDVWKVQDDNDNNNNNELSAATLNTQFSSIVPLSSHPYSVDYATLSPSEPFQDDFLPEIPGSNAPFQSQPNGLNVDTFLNTQPVLPELGSPAAALADLRILTNEALLDILDGWQEEIWLRGEDCVIEHTEFQNLMIELVQREMVDMNWCWMNKGSSGDPVCVDSMYQSSEE